MLQRTPHIRLLVCVDPVDFRTGIDGLVRICRAELAEAPGLVRAHSKIGASPNFRAITQAGAACAVELSEA
jgi:hypothetical protein